MTRSTEFFRAIEHGSVGDVLASLKSGVDPNSLDKNGWAALFRSFLGKMAIPKILIDAGANVNIMCNGKWTPLHQASYTGNLEMVKFLLNSGADVNAKDDEDLTPLHYASQFVGDPEVLQAILMYSPHINSQSKNGWTPLHTAAYNNNAITSYFLLKAGANPNLQDDGGWTPLHWAARNGNVQLIRILLNADAEFSIKDHSGHTAWKYLDDENPIRIEELHEYNKLSPSDSESST